MRLRFCERCHPDEHPTSQDHHFRNQSRLEQTTLQSKTDFSNTTRSRNRFGQLTTGHCIKSIHRNPEGLRKRRLLLRQSPWTIFDLCNFSKASRIIIRSPLLLVLGGPPISSIRYPTPEGTSVQEWTVTQMSFGCF